MPELPDEEWYLPTDDGAARLYVYETGQGEPVIVLHGGPGHSHGYLRKAVDGLTDKFRFVFYDQRGCLLSPAPIESVSLDANIADLEALRRELGHERMSVLAHSAGTLLAMAYLDRYPDRVGPVVLAGCLPPRSAWDDHPEIVEPWRKRAQAFAERSEVEKELAAHGLDRDDLGPKDATHAWRIKFASVNVYHVDRWRQLDGGQIFYDDDVGQAAGFRHPWDYTRALASHRFPITVIVGDHDINVTPPLVREVVNDVPGVELVEVPKAGHNIWIDQPERFRELVRAGLGGER